LLFVARPRLVTWVNRREFAMSTRSAIARQAGDGFIGRYHHSDGYPSGVGQTLYRLYNGQFKRDAAHMLKVLVDEHPAGWSTIIGSNLGECADFSKKIGFRNRDHGTADNPQCYCHGDRHEEEYTITESTVGDDIEYIYVINERDSLMTIISRHTDRVYVVRLDGPEPWWRAVENELDGEEDQDE
jgi:hypothetical protein